MQLNPATSRANGTPRETANAQKVNQLFYIEKGEDVNGGAGFVVWNRI